MDPVEIEITVPWGTIAGKTWGSNTNQIVLLFHGLLDNAGSFDCLIPLLPYAYYYVSIDLPGHGKSSHISPALTLQAMDYVFVIKLITEHFKSDKYVIIGHSFGAILAIQFGLVYPEKIELLFVLDSLWFHKVQPDEFRAWMRKKFDGTARANETISNGSDLTVTYEQAVETVSLYRYPNCELTRRSAEVLLKRSLVECGGGLYKFTRDLRLRSYMGYPHDDRYAMEVLSGRKFGFKAVFIMTRYNDEAISKEAPAFYGCVKKFGEWFVVDGNHHVHLNEPEIVAPVINSFLEESSFPV